MNDLIIIGASGFGREVAWLVERINQVKQEWNLLEFLDDNPDIQKEVINGYPVRGQFKDAEQFVKVHFTCAIGADPFHGNVIFRHSEALSELQFACLLCRMNCPTPVGSFNEVELLPHLSVWYSVLHKAIVSLWGACNQMPHSGVLRMREACVSQ